MLSLRVRYVPHGIPQETGMQFPNRSSPARQTSSTGARGARGGHISEGFAYNLHSQLQAWASAYHTSPAFRDQTAMIWQDPPLPDNTDDGLQPQSLAETFFSAASIYLAGVFDYEICHWQRLHLPPPALSEDEIQQHVSLILASSQRLVVETSLCPLLLLVPLRVASARARTVEQRHQIMDLFGLVGSRFAVARAIVAD